MSTICTKIDELERFLEHNLKQSRYEHSLGVEEMAVKLAKAHGANVKKARFAGRYHDIAKCFTQEESNRLVRLYGLPEFYRNKAQLAHSKLATEILRRDFDVTDEKVLQAVSSHTTGRRGMKKLEKIVYVADAIERNREYDGIKKLRKLALKDLDAACLFIMDYTIDKLNQAGIEIDNDTVEAREYIDSLIKEK